MIINVCMTERQTDRQRDRQTERQTDNSGFYLGRREGGHGDEFEVGITDQLPGQPEEGFLEVVVGLGGDVVVLEVLLAMEYDRLGLHFAILEMQMRE